MSTRPSEITEEMQAQIGSVLDRRVSFPVDAGDIRRWAIAVYWPEVPPPLYWDEDHARTTRFGEIVAPEEFNPFAWPPDPAANAYNAVELKSATGRTRLLGGTDTTYHVPIRVGDVITEVQTLASIEERPAGDGSMLMFIREYRWTNQRDELVKVELYTVIER